MTEERDERALNRFLDRADAILRGAEEAHQPAPDAGVRLGHYRLIRRLGQGGMGVVWLAEDEQLQRTVALKVLAAHMTVDREAIWRFGQEATAAARLDHPGIVAVHDAGEQDGVRYLVMDYIEGVGLDRLVALLRGRKPHEVTQSEAEGLLDAELGARGDGDNGSYVRLAVEWAAQAATALHHAHTRGVLHRDLKPSNLLIDRDRNLRMVDFGLARIEEAAPITRTGAILGTLTYMAPEALAGKPDRVDTRVDIYGLGAVLYELLAFRPPFDSESLTALIDEINHDTPQRLARRHPGLPRDLELIVAKCLAKERDHRYATAQDLAEDLRSFLEGRPVRARSAGPAQRLKYWVRRNPAKAAAAGAAVLLLVAAFVALRFAEARRIRVDAAEERARASARLEEFKRTRDALDRLRDDYLAKRKSTQRHLDPGLRESALQDVERSILKLETDAARFLEEARGALERAARIEGGMSTETRRAFADYYLFRFELAVAERDVVREKIFRDAVERHDVDGHHLALLEGAATLTVTTEPTAATVFLFRYEPYDTVRQDRAVVPRLVPVPTDGRDSDREDRGGSLPGDPCLVVTAVQPGSKAADAGVVPGDFVVRIQGNACGDGVFVSSVEPDGRAAGRSVAAWDRIESVDRIPLRAVRDWAVVGADPPESEYDVGILDRGRFVMRRGQTLEAALGVQVVGAEAILDVPAPAGGGRLDLVRAGRHATLLVPAGQRAGIDCDRTAYPLLPTREIPNGRAIDVIPGSYLLLVRAPNHEDQRFPVYVPRRSETVTPVTLLPERSTPPGCVWIPPGNFLHEEDGKLEPVCVDGFFLRRTEVTLAEWFEFVNDPATLARIRSARAAGRTIYLPRHYDDVELVRELPDGRYEPVDPPEAPVFGISKNDVNHFLAWRNRKAGRWTWRMPEATEWAKAARGVDGRQYPWGDRYSEYLCVNQHLRPGPWLRGVRGRFEPRDESPFGVADVAGSRREWGRAGLHGASWADGDARYFRMSFVEGLGEGYFNWSTGFRPVVERR